jgi:riboflavin synthase
MFSGIIESFGIVKMIEEEGQNFHFTIQSDIALESYIDQSIAHNGVCLTVIAIQNDTYKVTAINETLKKTNLGTWKVGDLVNLERAVKADARMDGHFVQGHVDTSTKCIEVENHDGSWVFKFHTPSDWNKHIVPKGSICINGVSLTLVEANDEFFSVAIIPYTYDHTNFKKIKSGDTVNIEFDILGKYIINYLNKLSL